MREERVLIPCQGRQLEGLLNRQEALSHEKAILLCHPHPQYGGDMHNGVISAGVEAAAQSGFPTLRFNFRGVGRSEGVHDQGVGETEDVRGAVAYLFGKLRGDQSSIILVGYSFGAWVGLPVAVEDERVNGMVAIAPPVELYNFDFLKKSRKKKFLLSGSRDDFCPMPSLHVLYEALEEPKSLLIVPEANHFFVSHLSSLRQSLKEIFQTI